jgi:SAM-dependent methyltransferase
MDKATAATEDTDSQGFAPLETCPVCGGHSFTRSPILWDALIREWNLSPAEADYVDLQQGMSCAECKNNLRSMTLAASMNRAFDHTGTLQELCASDPGFRRLTLVEINPAGGLTPTLKLLPNHLLRAFPEFDMQRIKFADDSIDIILHSDTLEHVPDPGRALRECWRTLKPQGDLFYTVPVIVGRMTKRREGLPPSYHCTPGTDAEDLKVRTEYGADFWCEAFEAGFRDLTLTSLIFPASVAIHAKKG